MSKTFAQPRPFGAGALSLLIALAALLTATASSQAAPGPLALQVTPSPAGFAPTTVGEKTPLEVDVFNEGEEANIEKVVVEGGDQGDFGNFGSNCGSLGEGQHCSIWLAFAPGSVGEKHSTVYIRFSGGARPEESFEVSGTGVAPQLSFSPSSYDFGVQRVNSGAEGTTFQLHNDGEGPVQLGSIDFTNGESFWIGGSDCFGRTLQVAESCSIQVNFGPNNTGPYSTKLRVNADGGSFTADISGFGARAETEAFPNPADFGAATVGSTGATQTITLTNSGLVPNGFFIAIISGGDSASFRLLDENCTGHLLSPGETCVAHVRFNPIAAGPLAATLSFFGEGDGPLQMPIRGEGVAAAAAISPAGFDFGSQLAGTRSAAHAFAVRNQGTTPVSLASTTIVGSNLDQFALAGDECTGVVLAPGQECLVRIRFAPQSTGARTATLRIGSDSGVFTALLVGHGSGSSKAAADSRLRKRHFRFLRGTSLHAARAHR